MAVHLQPTITAVYLMITTVLITIKTRYTLVQYLVNCIQISGGAADGAISTDG